MANNHLVFGLMSTSDTLELPRTILPLKSVRYKFNVTGGMAEIEMTQIYCQENPQPLDCDYLFPLPADGAVYRCEAVINGRVIKARIEEREAALKLVEEKKAQGHRTALVESVRDNLFTLSLGNLQPQDLVEIKLSYLQPLRQLAGRLALDLPLCPSVRYIAGKKLLRSNSGSGASDDTDQVPDASRITPPRIDREHPDAAFIDLDGQFDAEFLEGEIQSPSHRLKFTRTGFTAAITLAHGGNIPDRDIALRWNERQPAHTALRGWLSGNESADYALLELRAPSTVESSDHIAQDCYFLVDRSGSMEGTKWQKAVQALHGCIATLGKNDRAMITFFESQFQDFDSQPASPEKLRADPKFKRIASLGTDGGTEMQPALRHVLEKFEAHSKNRPTVLILITDAAIGNEKEITSLLRRYPSLAVHCFCIDTVLNDSLMMDLIRQQGGTCHALNPNDDVAGIITQLGHTLRQPVLVNLKLANDGELAAGAIPNLYAGQNCFVSVRTAGKSPDQLKVLAVDQAGKEVVLDFNLARTTGDIPRLRWNKDRLVNLVSQEDNVAAISLSKKANLLCPLTAFVAWDEAEKVCVASHQLIQPSLEPGALGGAQVLRKCTSMSSLCAAIPAPDYSVGDELPTPFFDVMSETDELDSREVIAQFPLRIKMADSRDDFRHLLKILSRCVNELLNSADQEVFARLQAECDRRLSEWESCEGILRALIGGDAWTAEKNIRKLVGDRGVPKISYGIFRGWYDALTQNKSSAEQQSLDAGIARIAQLQSETKAQLESFFRLHFTDIPRE